MDKITRGELRHFLKLDKSFSKLSSADFESVLPQFTCIKYREGDTILHQGDYSDSFHFVTDGKIEIWVEKEGVSRMEASLGPGTALGAQGM